MPESRYIVLLNDALKDHILTLTERERVRLREKFEFLENGFWDAGVRVKKLKGAAGRVVFEARLSKGDRLLFTLGDYRGRTAIYVWGIAHHDDVGAGAARIAPRNAPFLDFAPMGGEDRDDLSLDAAPRAWLSQEDVEQKVPEDYGPQRWLVLDDEEWRRLLSSPRADAYEAFLFLTREQEDMLRAVPPVLLSGTAGSGKTTLSVYYLLRGASAGRRPLFITYNPLLKALAERIYFGLIEKRRTDAPPATPRFSVLRDLMREALNGRAKDFPPEREVGLREFTQIFGDHRDRRKYDPELVWEEIRAIVKGSKLPLAPARCARLVQRFIARDIARAERDELGEHLLGLQELSIARRVESFIGRRTSLGDYPGFLRAMRDRTRDASEDCRAVLEEVLRQVERSASDFGSPLLSADEYMALGRKRAPAFLYDRREIYAIAEFYQDRLSRSGRWDEIDLTKAALRSMDGAREEFSYDLVVCDEVQDLTDVQLSLLFRLASDPRSVVLTGDPRQIVNPSGFRWEEVKGKLYARGLPAPEVRRLCLNFRCVGSIVRLSNALLDIKAALVGLTDTDMREEWKFGGGPPLILDGFTEGEALAGMDFRTASHAILARTADERDRVKRALSTELVFTIAEAKGLEFDTIVLWRFCEGAQAETAWSAILSGEQVSDARLPHVRHELALLYVAVTRARSALIVWDGEAPSVIWDIPAVASLVVRAAEKERLAGLMATASTPAEWEAQGGYFMDRGHYAAARECFKNAGNDGRQALAGALALRAQGDAAGAAALFESAGERAQAAECWERSGEWRRALTHWNALGGGRRAALCAVRVHELDGDHAAAARGWEELGEPARALECWEKAGAHDRVGRALAAAGEYERAARLLEKARLPLEAAACWTRVGQEERAADLYAQGGELSKAARLYKRRGCNEKLLRVYKRMGDAEAIAALHEARGDLRAAVDALAAFAGVSGENRAKVFRSVPEVKSSRSALKAAIRYAALGMPDKAGPLFLRGRAGAMAAQEMEKAGDSAGLAQVYEGMGRNLDAAHALEKDCRDEPAMADRIQRLLYRHLADAPTNERKAVEALHAEALRMKSDGRLVPALARFRLLRDEENVRETCRELGWHEEALRWFLDMEAPREVTRYAGLDGVTVSREFVDGTVRELWTGPEAGSKRHIDWREPLLALLAASLRGAPLEEARSRTERLFADLYNGVYIEEHIPRVGLDLLLAHHVSNIIIPLLRFDAVPARAWNPRLQGFIGELTRAARESGDRDLAACAAYAVSDDDFERAVKELPLADGNVLVVAASAARYPLAAARLAAMGRAEEAMRWCRLHEDPGLAARYAEEAGDMREAGRQYANAREYAEAMRCFDAAGDEQGRARTYERMGRVDEALAIWIRLGNRRQEQRLRKKQGPGGA